MIVSRYIRLILCTIACCFTWFSHTSAQTLSEVKKVYDSEGKKADLPSLWSEKMAVFVFYSTDCPLSIKYTKTIRDLQDELLDYVDFYIVYSGKYDGEEAITAFNEKYGFNLPYLTDPKYNLADAIEATVTPECFLVKDGEVKYRGAINDWVIKLGSVKTEVREHYLKNAVQAVTEEKEFKPTAVKAIGCFIR